LPFDATAVKGIEPPAENYTSVKLLLKDGGERIVEGAELTDDVRRFVDGLAALMSSKGSESKKD
jgi:hypothetical protein